MILDRLPTIIKKDGVIADYTEAHDEEFETLSSKNADAITAKQVANASGDDLDRIGAVFGEVGKRNNRGDGEYSSYLQSVVISFNGRGSVIGMKGALSTATGVSEENIVIDEDFTNLEYTVTINGSTPLSETAVETVAEFADPSGVELTNVTIN